MTTVKWVGGGKTQEKDWEERGLRLDEQVHRRYRYLEGVCFGKDRAGGEIGFELDRVEYGDEGWEGLTKKEMIEKLAELLRREEIFDKQDDLILVRNEEGNNGSD